MLKKGAPRLWLWVLFPFAVGYFLSYLFRTVNAVISPDLTKELGLSAGDLGLLTSAYFFSFALFQLPLGILLDRYSPKRVEAVLLLIAALGAVVFSLSDTSTGLAAGRALIGFGVSACLMAGYTACAIWFAPQKVPAANAMILSAGGLGALTATAPVEAALRFTDWRGLFLVLAALAVGAAALIFSVVPERQRTVHHSTWREQWQGALSVFKNAAFWRIAPAATLTQASFLAIQGLWAGPWLRNVAGLPRETAAAYLFWTAAAMVAGQLTWGILATRLAHRGIAPLFLLKTGMGMFLLAQVTIVAGSTSLAPWIVFGFFGVAGSLAYPIISQQFPAALTGRANTAINLLVFVGAFAAQWAIGVIVDAWPAPGGRSQPTGYSAAFAIILGVEVLAFFWLIMQTRAADTRSFEQARRTSIPDSLLHAYQNTRYTACLPKGEITLRIGQPSPTLDALLRDSGYPYWAYVTAYNPGSKRDDTGNAARQSRLLVEVQKQGLPWFPGRAIADDGNWPAEESLLVLGLNIAEARSLGRAYGQLAVVAGKLGGAAELVACEAPGKT